MDYPVDPDAPSSGNPNPPLTKIEEGLYLGDSWSSRTRQIIEGENINAVLSVATEPWSRGPWFHERIWVKGQHLFVRCNDSMTQDILPDLARMCDFIDKHRVPGAVLVHCEKGISRSATVLIAYLMRTHGHNLDTALKIVQEKRKVKPNANFLEQLKVWEDVKYEIWEDSEKTVPKAEYAAYLAIRAERLKERGLTGKEPIGLQSIIPLLNNKV